MNPPKPRTVLGFDFGTRKIGVAVGNELTGAATPLTTLRLIRQRIDWQAIAQLLDEWQADALLVGLPLHMDGSRQEMSATAERFSRQLHGRFGLPVYLVDERLTSLEADRLLQQAGVRDPKQRISASDPWAAKLIVETWMGDQHA